MSYILDSDGRLLIRSRLESDEGYICVRDVKLSGTVGGDFTSGAWQTRDVNNEQADTANLCTISSNQITLDPGTYRCLIQMCGYRVNRHQARLYNVTNSTVLIYGGNAFAHSNYNTVNLAEIVGSFTLGVQSVLEIQHRCETTRASNGFGAPSGWGDEIYLSAAFWRL